MTQELYIPATGDRMTAIERLSKVLLNLPMARYKVSIEEAKPVRSNAQNAYLWGVIYRTILEAGQLEGWTAEDLHQYFLGEKFGWDLVTGFGAKRQRPVRRSSKLSKLEFIEYTQFIQQRMSEFGVYIPDPNE